MSVVANGPASGLTEMLRQFIEQTLVESPRKREQAARLSGEVAFRAAEDREISVRIVFAGDRIELHDGAAARASITADFLTIAHLASGRGHPLWLLARRRLSVRAPAFQLPFLLGVLRLMRIGAEGEGSGRERYRAARIRLAWGAAAAAAGAAIWWVATIL